MTIVKVKMHFHHGIEKTFEYELNAPAGEQTERNNMANLNQATTITDEELKDVMDYHAWDEEKIAKGKLVRESLAAALKVIVENVPPSPDRSCAIRKLRDARMDCNSAITHNGKY